MRFELIETQMQGKWAVMRGQQPATCFEGTRRECLAYIMGFEAAWTWDNRKIDFDEHG